VVAVVVGRADRRDERRALRRRARARGALPADGCDCTHYCWSPHFWRHYFAALRDAIRG